MILHYENLLLPEVIKAFMQCWPEADAEVVSEDSLRYYLHTMGDNLKEVISRFFRRLRWAINQMVRLDEVRHEKGTLDAEEDSLYARCDRLIKKLKGLQFRRHREAEGYDDTYTYGVLAAEGFLPGYGIDTGTVLAYHQAPPYATDIRDWEIRRCVAIALREFIPGNLIYANGHRFLPRFFHLEPVDPTLFQVDTANESIAEIGAAAENTINPLGASALRAVPICDVDLPHQSRISDEEEYRFQMGVAIYGYEQARHSGGKAYSWGTRVITHRTAVQLRIVNAGPSAKVQTLESLGYPVCQVCGQSRSPLASRADLDAFYRDHRERCRAQVQPLGFYADIIADALTLQDCANREEAYSIMETIRKAAAHLLDMEMEDLQLLCIGRPGQPQVTILLYDPMPGGSGLLEQMITRWEEIVGTAIDFVENCAGECERSCIDCLQHFRNAFYHRYLNRHHALECLQQYGNILTFTHNIPSAMASTPDAQSPVNLNEQNLKAMLDRAGFSAYRMHHPIELGRPLGTTYPDYFFEDPHEIKEGICIYLDGMSNHIHGNPTTAHQDRQIREELRSRNFEVIEITLGQLQDLDAMKHHFFRLGKLLSDKQLAEQLAADPHWFA